MATLYKILGQIVPTANTANLLYTVPASTNTVVSTLSVCNRATTAKTFRLATVPSGATLASNHYIAYDTTVPGNETISLTLGISLAANDQIYVYAVDNNVTFAAYGAEIS